MDNDIVTDIYVNHDIPLFDHQVALLTTPIDVVFQRIFRETMLFQFVGVLLQSLITRSHDLLREDTTATLYSMAAVDFDVFFGELLPSFLTSSDGLDSSQKSSLAANFSTHTVSRESVCVTRCESDEPLHSIKNYIFPQFVST